MLVVAMIAILLFGSELPNVARTWGKHVAEFRRHLSGIRDELNSAIYAEPDPAPRQLQRHPEFHRESNGTPESAALASPPTTRDAVVDTPAVEPPVSQTAPTSG
jgi:Sec-independent protein translocase protein TatA